MSKTRTLFYTFISSVGLFFFLLMRQGRRIVVVAAVELLHNASLGSQRNAGCISRPSETNFKCEEGGEERTP